MPVGKTDATLEPVLQDGLRPPLPDGSFENDRCCFVHHRSGGFTGVPEDFFVAQARLQQAGSRKFSPDDLRDTPN